MADPEYLDVPALARRLKVKEATVHTMVRRARRNRERLAAGELTGTPRGDLPQEDLNVAGHMAWRVETIERWEARRPGHGWRAGHTGPHLAGHMTLTLPAG